jgi:hypothetical protein
VLWRRFMATVCVTLARETRRSFPRIFTPRRLWSRKKFQKPEILFRRPMQFQLAPADYTPGVDRAGMQAGSHRARQVGVSAWSTSARFAVAASAEGGIACHRQLHVRQNRAGVFSCPL